MTGNEGDDVDDDDDGEDEDDKVLLRHINAYRWDIWTEYCEG